MSKHHSEDNGDGTSSWPGNYNQHHSSDSRQGESYQSDRYTVDNDDKGKSDASKTHEYSGYSVSKGSSYEGGRGENYNESSK